MKQYSYIVESVMFLALIVIGGFIFGDPGFIHYEFHPYYLVILLITIRYGYAKGVYSMLLSGVLYVIFCVTLGKYTDLESVLTSCYQPLAFLAFWMFVGLLVNIDKKKIEQLKNIELKSKKSVEQKVEELKKLSIINENISNELISSDQSFNILFERTKNLFNEDVMMLYTAAYEILAKIIQTQQAYILYMEGDNYEVALPEHAGQDWKYYHVQDKEEIVEVRKTHQFIRVDMLDSQKVSTQTPIFVGPIIHQSTDTLFGIIVVQELDLLKYNKNTFRTFVNLCKWMGEIMYFRTRQNLNVRPIKSNFEYKYLVDYGANRDKIKNCLLERIQ